MARYDDADEEYDFDGSSFADDDDDYMFAWQKTHVNVSAKNPLTWIMWLFATIWNGIKWSAYTWLAHIMTFAYESSTWTYARKISIEVICAGAVLVICQWFPPGQLRGWLYAPLQVVMIVFAIDIIAIVIATALTRFGGRRS